MGFSLSNRKYPWQDEDQSESKPDTASNALQREFNDTEDGGRKALIALAMAAYDVVGQLDALRQSAGERTPRRTLLIKRDPAAQAFIERLQSFYGLTALGRLVAWVLAEEALRNGGSVQISMEDLAARLNTTAPNISTHVGKLIELGLFTRTRGGGASGGNYATYTAVLNVPEEDETTTGQD